MKDSYALNSSCMIDQAMHINVNCYAFFIVLLLMIIAKKEEDYCCYSNAKTYSFLR
jgi:hypothetical protein